MIVAIDGPAASGKSTVAKAVARRLGFHYLDTGAMYRAVAAFALYVGIDVDDEPTVAALAESAPVSFTTDGVDPVPVVVEIAGMDVTTTIRTPEVDLAVSPVARIPGVRVALVARQRELAGGADTVVEGRDIGTVVFPDAPVKVYLTASEEERARRRHVELVEKGVGIGADDVAASMTRRDTIDSTRAASPLAVADDAHVLDTTGMTIDEVVDAIVALVEAAR